MAASEGVDLEWAIVRLGRGEDIKKLKREYSSRILDQAQRSHKQVVNTLGNKIEFIHSDEMKISAKPEPKTDIVVKRASTSYYTSVKMEGGIQLASGQGASTAELFRETGKVIFDGNKAKLKQVYSLAEVIEEMPTRLLASQNLDRILEEADPKVLKEFVKSGKIMKEKNADLWIEQVKPKIITDIHNFIRANPEFYSEMIYEALSGKRTLARFRGAAATHVLSPAGFHKIDSSYISHIKNKVKLDIRTKSRGGITSIAFRIETKGSL